MCTDDPSHALKMFDGSSNNLLINPKFCGNLVNRRLLHRLEETFHLGHNHDAIAF